MGKHIDLEDWDPMKAESVPNLLHSVYSDVIPDEVECGSCGAKHDANAETFFSFYGNVMVGFSGGLIGNNFGDMKLKRIMILCRKARCMGGILRHIDWDGFEGIIEAERFMDKELAKIMKKGIPHGSYI